MKNLIKLKVATVLGVAFIVASCGTSNSVVNGGLISKRKHTKGFHLNLPSSTGSVLAKKEKDEKNNEKALSFSQIKESKSNENFIEANASNTVLAETIINKEDRNVENKTTSILVSQATDNTHKLTIKENTSSQIVKMNQQEMESKKPFQKKTNNHSSSKDDDILLILLAIFVPFLAPLAVYLHEGGWNRKCTINLILTICCLLPGIIHAIIVILE